MYIYLYVIYIYIYYVQYVCHICHIYTHTHMLISMINQSIYLSVSTLLWFNHFLLPCKPPLLPISLGLLGWTTTLAPRISRLDTWLKMGQGDSLSQEFRFCTEIYRDRKWLEVSHLTAVPWRGSSWVPFALISRATLIPILPKVWLSSSSFNFWWVSPVSSQSLLFKLVKLGFFCL